MADTPQSTGDEERLQVIRWVREMTHLLTLESPAKQDVKVAMQGLVRAVKQLVKSSGEREEYLLICEEFPPATPAHLETQLAHMYPPDCGGWQSSN